MAVATSFVCELSAQRGNAFDVLPENFADIDTIFSIVVSVTLVSIHNGALWAMAHVDFDEATQTTAEEPASIHEESQCRK